MRLDGSVSRDELRAALERSARETWSGERVEALADMLDQAADAVWAVTQVPLAPLSEEPDLPLEPAARA